MKKIIFILLLIPLIMVGQNFNFKKFDTTNIYDKIRFDSTILANRIYQDSLLLSDKVDSVWVDLDSLRVIDNGIYSVYPLATVPTILRDTMYRNIDSIIHINNNGLKSFIIDDDTCIISGTRSQLLALRTANALKSSCAYIITDHVQGRLVAGTQIRLTAVSTNEFSENVSVNTTYDNEAWRGIYDIDRALVLELQDNRNNIARGLSGTEVANFDWGNTFITDVLVDNATWITTYGATRTVQYSEIKNSSTLNTTGQVGGTINRLVLDNISFLDLTGANVGINNFNITNQSNFSATNYLGGNTLLNWSLKSSQVNISNSTSQITISSVEISNSILNHSSVTTGTITGTNLILNNTSTIQHNNGALNLSLNRVELKNQGQISHLQGSIALSNYSIESGSIVSQSTVAGGNISMSEGKINGSSNITNQSACNINGTRLNFDRTSNVTCINGSTGTITLTGTKFDNGSYLTVGATSTSGNISITSCTFDNNSFSQKTNTGILTISGSTLHNNSRITLSNLKNLSVSRVFMANLGNIASTGTIAGITDNITDCSLIDRASISFSSNGATGNNMFYNSLNGINGVVTFSGTTSGFNMQQCKADNGSFSFTNNTFSNTLTLSSAINAGNIIIQNMTIAKSMQYFVSESNSSININNPTGVGSIAWVYAVNRSNISITGTSTTTQNLYAENGGSITQNGGQSINITKQMTGTLTTGNFNHSNLIMISPTSRTLTGANTNRSEYLGIVSTAPLF